MDKTSLPKKKIRSNSKSPSAGNPPEITLIRSQCYLRIKLRMIFVKRSLKRDRAYLMILRC